MLTQNVPLHMPGADLVVFGSAMALVLLVVLGKPKKKGDPGTPTFVKGYVINKEYWAVGQMNDGTFRVGPWREKDQYSYIMTEPYRTFEHAEKSLLIRELKPSACHCCQQENKVEGQKAAS